MIDPSLPVQKAIVGVLRGDSTLEGLLGGKRVFDRVPPNQPFPYVRVGDSQTIDDGPEDLAAAESFENVHVWSGEPGKVQAKQIAARIAVLLDDELTIEGHHLIVWEIEDVRHLDGGDGLTSHSVVTVRFETEPA